MQKHPSAQVIFTRRLRSRGYRSTKAKQVVFDLLYQSNRPLSIKEIVSSTDIVHYVSVYRAVDSLQEAGILRLVPQGFKSLFELSELFQDHHHHATCENCGRTSTIHDERLEIIMKELSLSSGMKSTSHQFEIYGVCNNCASKI